VTDHSRWHSPRLEREATLARWGRWGQPVLLFPTAGGDAFEMERMHVIAALMPLIDGGRIKVYSCDSIAGQAWVSRRAGPGHCCWLQNRFGAFVAEEVVPAIRADCRSDAIQVITAGASIGAFNAVAALCRYPWLFSAALGMSGTYDLEQLFGFQATQDFYFASPLLFMPGLSDQHQLALLRTRFVLLTHGQGRWEEPNQSWRMADVLGAKGVPNMVEPWGPEWDHDWPTWRRMLPLYIDRLAARVPGGGQ
jgi:esterase/lipase superfamily enzyme